MIHPIVAHLPAEAALDVVVAPPYDALRPGERYAYAHAHPDNFISVILSPDDFPNPVDPVDLGTQARQKLDAIKTAHYGPPQPPAFYIYEMEGSGHRQRGVVGGIRAGDVDMVLGHERVLPRRVDALAAFYESTGINTSPISMTFRDLEPATRVLRHHAQRAPDLEYRGSRGIVHRIWRVTDLSIRDAFATVDRWYITDGHHRTAAALAGLPSALVLVVAFPESQMQVLGYHRVVHSRPPDDFLARIAPWFETSVSNVAPAPRHGSIIALFDGLWHRLERAGPRSEDPVQSLDVALLHREIIEGAMGVRDDSHIDYIVGADSTTAIAGAVADGEIGFVLHPPTVAEIMAVADAGLALPPKSTWFTPKVRSGLFIVDR